jgi:hypothetical protein
VHFSTVFVNFSDRLNVLGSSLFIGLPNELKRAISDEVLSDKTAFLRMRHILCALCTSWLYFIWSTPQYWNTIRVNSRIPKEGVIRFLELAGELPIDFQLKLITNADLNDLSYILPFFSRASDITMTSSDRVSLSRLHDLFKGVRASGVRYFGAFIRRSDGYMDRNRDYSVTAHPWFGGTHHNLEVLHLQCTVLPFINLVFPSLREFRLWGSHPLHAIDITDLSSIILASPSLREVAFGRFSCEGVDDPNISSISSPTITALELAFSKDGSIRQLASVFDFPSLVHFTVHVSNEMDVQDLLYLPVRLFTNITHLTIRNPSVRAWPFRLSSPRVFPLFAALTVLNIRGSRSAVFLDLLNTAEQHALYSALPFIPRLSVLTMNYGPVDGIRCFAGFFGACEDSSGDHMVLRSIHAGNYGVSSSINRLIYLMPDYLWLVMHVVDFKRFLSFLNVS